MSRLEHVKKILENHGIKCRIEKVSKNGKYCNALALGVGSDESESSLVAPIVYEWDIENMDDDHILECAKYIMNKMPVNVGTVDDVERMIADFNEAKKHLRLGIRQKGEDGITTAPYLDLELFCYLMMGEDEHGCFSTLVRPSFLKMWKVDSKEVFKIATQNMKDEFVINSLVDKMKEIMEEMPDCDEKELLEASITLEETMPHQLASDILYISTRNGFMGSVALVFTNVLKTVAKRMHTDKILIFPSSTHELLAIKYADDAIDRARDLVRDVNASVTGVEIFLSDSVYLYDTKTNKVTIA